MSTATQARPYEADAINMRRFGKTIRQISAATGASPPVLSRLFKNLGIERPDPEDRLSAIDDYETAMREFHPEREILHFPRATFDPLVPAEQITFN